MPLGQNATWTNRGLHKALEQRELYVLKFAENTLT